MTAPLEFASRCLAREGALVDAATETVEAVLPPALATELSLAEHVLLGDGRAAGTLAVGYGSALLERLVARVSGEVPFVLARLSGPPPRSGVARAAAEAMVFRNGVFAVGAPVSSPGQRLLLHAAFTLHGDERREGLCAAAASLLHRGAVVPGFEIAAAGALEEAEVERPGAAELAATARAALAACAAQAYEAASGFREAMRRRLERDRERLEAYFGELTAELEVRVARGRVARGDAEERRRVLARERAAKIEALAARQATRVEVQAIAAVLVESPASRVPLELRRRKASRTVEVEYDAATRRLVLPPCEGCGGHAPRPAACDDAMHLLCEGCAPRSEGRVVCPACRAGRPRKPSAEAA
jgi:hypothetical protein